MSIEKNPQYDAIQSALDSGKRIVYSKQSDAFISVSRSQAKALADDPNFVTKLPQLKEQIRIFVEKHGITDTQKLALEKAFEDRAKGLSDRFVVFGRSERDAAVTELTEIKNIIHKTTSQASKISTVIPPSTPGPSTGITQKPQPGVKEILVISPAIPELSPKEQETSQELFTGVPPPPFGAPPPPPPPPQSATAQGPQKSYTHQKLITNADKLKRFKGEPERPKLLDEKHDLGKLSEIKDPKQREKYVQDIDAYLNGTTKTVPGKKRGLVEAKPEVVRENNGLKHTLDRIKPMIQQRDQLVETIAARKAEMASFQSRIQKNKENESELQDHLTKGTPYKTTKETAKGSIPITFFPEKTIKKMQEDLTKETEAYFKRAGLEVKDLRSIEWKIKDSQEENKDLEAQIETCKKEIEDLGNEKKRIESLEENGIKFDEWATYVEEKDKIYKSWDSVQKTLKGEVKATTSGTSKTENQDALDTHLSDRRFAPLRALQETKAATPMTQQTQMKSSPDQFYRETGAKA